MTRLEEHEAADIQVFAQKKVKTLSISYAVSTQRNIYAHALCKAERPLEKNIWFWLGRRFFERGLEVSVQLHSEWLQCVEI